MVLMGRFESICVRIRIPHLAALKHLAPTVNFSKNKAFKVPKTRYAVWRNKERPSFFSTDFHLPASIGFQKNQSKPFSSFRQDLFLNFSKISDAPTGGLFSRPGNIQKPEKECKAFFPFFFNFRVFNFSRLYNTCFMA